MLPWCSANILGATTTTTKWTTVATTLSLAAIGKCANRLLSTSGLPLLTKQMKGLELSSVWALLAAFEDPLPIPQTDSHGVFEGAFVRDVDSLSWMGNNTRKLFPMLTSTPECWTFFSTAAYGRRNEVPQENIPKVTAEKVKEDMLGGVELALGLSKGSLQQPMYTRVQLWGAGARGYWVGRASCGGRARTDGQDRTARAHKDVCTGRLKMIAVASPSFQLISSSLRCSVGLLELNSGNLQKKLYKEGYSSLVVSFIFLNKYHR